MLKKYAFMMARLVFALWYFCVGVIGFITNNASKDAGHSSQWQSLTANIEAAAYRPPWDRLLVREPIVNVYRLAK
jgi:hypothetical protein